MLSRDGSNWFTSGAFFVSPFDLPSFCSGIAYGAGVWVAVGRKQDPNPLLLNAFWSTDGSNFNPTQTPVWATFFDAGNPYTEIYGIVYDGTKFIISPRFGTNPASSNIAYSYDGKNWTSAGITGGNFNNLAFNLGAAGSNVVLTTKVANSRIVTSANGGFSWTNANNLANCNVITANLDSKPYYDGTKWYIGIDQAFNSTNPAQNVFYSYNLSQWTNANITSAFIAGGYPLSFCYYPGSYNYIQSFLSVNNTLLNTTVITTNTFTTTFISTNILRAATANVTEVFTNFTSTNTTIEFINNIIDQQIQTLSSGIVVANEGILNNLSASFISTNSLQVNTVFLETLSAQTLNLDLLITKNLNVCSLNVKLGRQAGALNQGLNAVAIGEAAGQFNQASSTVAIGYEAGNLNQGENSVAIGYQAGKTNQATTSVAIGFQAGMSNQSTNTIVINASGNQLDTGRSNAFYVSPLREQTDFSGLGTTIKPLLYNSTTKEIFQGFTTIGNFSTFSTMFSSTLLIGKSTSALNFDMEGIAQFSTSGNVFVGLSSFANGMSLTWNEVRPGIQNTEFIASRGPRNQNGWFHFYTGVNNNATPNGSNLAFTIANNKIGINVSTPTFEVDVNSHVRVNSTLSTAALFISSINGSQFPPSATISSNLTVSSATVNLNTTVSSIFTKSLAVNNLEGNGVTTLINRPSTMLWVAVGSDGGPPNTIKYSSDGINWNNANNTGGGMFQTNGHKVAWNGSMWVAVGNDGGGGDTIKYSYDGINWNNISSGFSGNNTYGIAWNGIMWVAVGDYAPTIQYSYNGMNWFSAAVSNLFANGGYGVAWGGNMWVAVGWAVTIKYSFDGLNWNDALSGSFSATGRGVAWNGSMWVAVGSGSGKTIKYSYDGIRWNDALTGVFTSIGYNVAWNGTMWVAGGAPATAGDGTIKYSYDGINWFKTFNDFNNNCRDVAWNGAMWVAVGFGPTSVNIKYSYDGINWTGASSGIWSTGAGYGIAYSQTLTPDIRMNNLNFYLQGQPTYLESTNQIFTTASTIVVNNTLYIDQNLNTVGINRALAESSSTFTVDVLGNIRATSTIIARDGVYKNSGFYTTSDSNLKENITLANLQTCYDNVKSIPLHRFTFNQEYLPTKDDSHQLGFIAQEVQTKFPHAVISMYDPQRNREILHLNNDQVFMAQYGATKVLLDEIRKQSTLIETLRHYTAHLETQISTLKLT
jgi:hypothetical protein